MATGKEDRAECVVAPHTLGRIETPLQTAFSVVVNARRQRPGSPLPFTNANTFRRSTVRLSRAAFGSGRRIDGQRLVHPLTAWPSSRP